MKCEVSRRVPDHVQNNSISDGHVNGSMGIVSKLKSPAPWREQIEQGELPVCVLLKFNDNTIGCRSKMKMTGCVAIPPAVAIVRKLKSPTLWRAN